MISAELNNLAIQALKNALHRRLQAIVASHMAAATGLRFQPKEFRKVKACCEAGKFPQVVIASKAALHGFQKFRQHATLLEALEDINALEIHIDSNKAFERVEGEWQYVVEEV